MKEGIEMGEMQATLEDRAEQYIMGMYSNPTDTDIFAVKSIVPILANISRFMDEDAMDVAARGLICAWWSGYDKGIESQEI